MKKSKANMKSADPTDHESAEMKKHRAEMMREMAKQKRGMDHDMDRMMMRDRNRRTSK